MKYLIVFGVICLLGCGAQQEQSVTESSSSTDIPNETGDIDDADIGEVVGQSEQLEEPLSDTYHDNPCQDFFFVYAIDISPDGREMALAGGSGSIVLLDLTTGRLRKVIRPEYQGPNYLPCVDDQIFTDIAYRPDGKVIAATRGITGYGFVHIDQIKAKVIKETVLAGADRVEFSRDGKRALLHGDHIGGELIELRGQKGLFSAVRTKHGEGVEAGREGNRCAMSPEARFVAMTEVANFTRFYDTKLNKQIAKIEHEYMIGPNKEICRGCNDIAFSPDGSMLSLLCSQLLVWDIARKKMISPTSDTLKSRSLVNGRMPWYLVHAWSPDGNRVALIGKTDGPVIWNLPTNSDDPAFSLPRGRIPYVDTVSDIEWHPNGGILTWVQACKVWFLRLSDDEYFYMRIRFEPDEQGRTVISEKPLKASEIRELTSQDVVRFMSGN